MSLKRPHVAANVATSLDGRLADRHGDLLASRHDRRHMDFLRHRVDAILLGAATLRAGAYPLQLRDPLAVQLRRARGLPLGIGCVVVSRSLRLPLKGSFFAQPLAPFVVLACPDQAAPLQDVEQWRCGADSVAWDILLHRLWQRGVRRLMVEAGGNVLGQLVAGGWLDDLYVTLCPRLVGDGPPMLQGQIDGGRLTLQSCLPRDDEVFCHYRVADR